MASIFEYINNWTVFLFTFLMINLIARLIACHFFSAYFYSAILKCIFKFVILVEFKTAASYFETCNFSDLIWWLETVKYNLARMVFKVLTCWNDTFLCQYPNLSNNLLGVTSWRSGGQFQALTGGDLVLGQSPSRLQMRSDCCLESWGGADFEPRISCNKCLAVCVLLAMLPSPASDPLLNVLACVSNDVLRGCKC